ncbi:MAG: hypothetical protein R3F65_00935 [bacterium]
MHRYTLRALTALTLTGLPGLALADPGDDLRRAVTARAEAAGIPSRPLLNKIDEGIAKGVPPARIAPVVAALHDRLVASRAVCADLADGGLCALAAADAVAAGATTDALQGLVTRHPAALAGPDRTRAFVAVAALQARGVAPDAAIGQVSQAIERSGGLDALVPRAAEPPPGTPPGLGGDLPVHNPASDRDNRGKGKGWGRGGADKPDKPDKPTPPGMTDNPGQGHGNGRDDDRGERGERGD